MTRQLFGPTAGAAIVVTLAIVLGIAARPDRALAQQPQPTPGAAATKTNNAKLEPAKAEPTKTEITKPQPAGTSAVVMDLSAIESVIGKGVKSSSGEDLGHIVDLLVMTSGQIRAAVIDFGGVLGVGSRKVAVNWKDLDFADMAKDGTVRLALTRDQVRVSPEYKSGDPVVIIQATRLDEPKPAPAPAKSVPMPAAGATPQGEAHKQ